MIGWAGVIVPATRSVDGAPFVPILWAVIIGLVTVASAATVRRRSRLGPLVALTMLAATFALVAQRSDGPLVVLLAIPAGLAVALAMDSRPHDARHWLTVGLGVAVLLAIRVVGGFGSVATAAVVMVAAGVATTFVARRHRQERPAHRSRRAVTALVVLVLFLGSYIGANNADAAWFGALTAHGPRSSMKVALTFDDGPGLYSEQVAKVLNDHGVRGTFFEVGKAIDARPDISRALLDAGQLLANHSYEHDEWRWLDPRYPELQRAQDAFKRHLGVCPTFYRPPHGQHTPFTAKVVADHSMTMITWDVASGDWNSHDPAAVVRQVLKEARPGSIILLHDGLDGLVTPDRSVLVQALPGIIDGLRAKGLQPVGLDELLGIKGYGNHC